MIHVSSMCFDRTPLHEHISPEIMQRLSYALAGEENAATLTRNQAPSELRFLDPKCCAKV